MDEMNNMNEVAIEETSNEVAPVVAENNEVHEEAKKLNINPVAAGIGGVALVGGAVYALYKKSKAKKADKKAKVEKKAGFGIELRSPIVIKKKDKPEATDVEYKDVVEDATEEEN